MKLFKTTRPFQIFLWIRSLRSRIGIGISFLLLSRSVSTLRLRLINSFCFCIFFVFHCFLIISVLMASGRQDLLIRLINRTIRYIEIHSNLINLYYKSTITLPNIIIDIYIRQLLFIID